LAAHRFLLSEAAGLLSLLLLPELILLALLARRLLLPAAAGVGVELVFVAFVSHCEKLLHMAPAMLCRLNLTAVQTVPSAKRRFDEPLIANEKGRRSKRTSGLS
jgi:hypothetical protein